MMFGFFLKLVPDNIHRHACRSPQIKSRFQKTGTKEIKKVAEARMRKRKRAALKLKAAKKQASVMAESNEVSEKQKLKVRLLPCIVSLHGEFKRMQYAIAMDLLRSTSSLVLSPYDLHVRDVTMRFQAISKAMKANKVEKPGKVYVVTRKTKAGSMGTSSGSKVRICFSAL
jgi:hypothetical protein